MSSIGLVMKSSENAKLELKIKQLENEIHELKQKLEKLQTELQFLKASGDTADLSKQLEHSTRRRDRSVQSNGSVL